MAEPFSQETLISDIASAPGNLPKRDIIARLASQRTQFRHDNTTVPLAPAPSEPIEIWATSGEDIPLVRTSIFYTTDGSLPNTSSIEVPMNLTTIDWDVQAGYLTRWQAIIPSQPHGTTVRYRIAGWYREKQAQSEPDLWAHDGQGYWFRFPREAGVTTFAFHVESPEEFQPTWVRDAIIYHIFLDRFHPGTANGVFPPDAGPQSIHGGTLRGVQQALPYLEELGVNCLWLSPFCAAESYHRYDAVDYYTVDPTLGTNEELRALTDAAHARSMHVIMDFVPSHCSWHHPAFVAAQSDPFASTASWFTFTERPHGYRNFLGAVPILPTLNADDPGARAYLIGSAVQWVRDYGIDGFRLDHAIGLSMDFWVAFRTAIRSVNPEAFTAGEVTDTPDCLRRYRSRLDAVLDFSLSGALRLTFGQEDWSVRQLDQFLNVYSRYMRDGPGRVSFLDNHDMNRFLFVARNNIERLKLAALCQFTLEPTPIIYYGTEIGLTQQQDISANNFGGDTQVRQNMPWNEHLWNQDLLHFYRALTHLRRNFPALRSGVRRTVHLDENTKTYAYLRSLPGQSEPSTDLLVIFNLSEHEQKIPLPPSLRNTYSCLLTSREMPKLHISESTFIALPLRTGAIFTLLSSKASS